MKNIEYRYLIEYKKVNKFLKLGEAIDLINDSVSKILFVLDESDKLIGTLTDGDIRRYIKNENINLNVQIYQIMNETPRYITEEQLEKLNFEEVKRIGVNYLPVLNQEKKIQKVLYFELNFQKLSKLNNKVIIMAGGKGVRLMPLTRVVPKPLVPFKDKTIIETIMEQFINNGFDDFILTVNYKKELIKQYFEELEYKIEFIEEETFLGTAGSVGLLRDFKLDKPFFVSNCDILLDIDYEEALYFHTKENSDITIITSLEKYDVPYGVVNTDDFGNYTGIIEKPKYNFLINTGIYILNPKIIDLVETNQRIDMPDLIDMAKDKGLNIKVFSSDKQMIDIGQWEYYKKFINVDN